MSKEDQGRRLRPMADTALLSYLYEVIQDAIAETEDNELTSLALDRKLQRAKGMLEKALGLASGDASARPGAENDEES